MKKYISIFLAALSVAAVTAAVISPSVNEPCNCCDGRGWFVCTMCDGDGWIECSSCNGEGYFDWRDGRREICSGCNGKKVFECGYCDRGKRECDCCYGTGKKRYVGQ